MGIRNNHPGYCYKCGRQVPNQKGWLQGDGRKRGFGTKWLIHCDDCTWKARTTPSAESSKP